MGNKNQTTTSSNTTTTSADPQAAALYRQILERAQGVAAQPYQSYTGELTAPVNAQQTAGINNINANAGFALPYVQQAAGMAQTAGQPLSGDDIQRYLSPYTQNVVDATQAQFNNQNAQAQAALTGNSIAQGALGGNRVGVAQANLAGQQQLAQAPVVAGLYNTGYQNAVQTAQGQQQAGLNAAYALGNFGVAGQNAALSGANAQIGAGTLQQQTQQAANTAAYNQFLQQQAFPFQTTQWLAGLGTGVGSQLGGTSTGQGTTTQPGPSPFSQVLGLGLSLASLFKDGGAVRRAGFADGGQITTPYGGAPSWVPVIGIHGGAGAPRASGSAPGPSGGQQAGFGDIGKSMKGFAGLGNLLGGPAWGGGNIFSGDAWGGSSSNPLPGLTAADYGPGFADGGGVIAGFADGGVPSFDDRFDAAFPNMVQPDAPPAAVDPVAGFAERFGDLPPAQENPSFQDAYARLYGTPVDAFASDRSPVPASPVPGLMPAEAPIPAMAPEDDARTAVAGFSPAMTNDAEAMPDEALGFAPRAAGVGAAPATVAAADDAAPAPEEAERRFSVLSALGFPPLSAAARSGLLTAGLAMMASRSPNFLQAVGEGGLAGVGAYGNIIAGDKKNALDQRRIDLEAQRLASDADRAAKDLALRTRSVDETIRHNKAAESKEFKPTLQTVWQSPVTGRKVYGVYDPNTRKAYDLSGAPIDVSKLERTDLPGDANGDLRGDDFIKSLSTQDPGLAATAKAVGDYKMDVRSLSLRGGNRERVLAAALRYNPTYDQTQFAGKNRAVTNFNGGVEGRTVRSLNVAIDHLGTLQEAVDALHNSNIPVLNQVKNAWLQATGSELPTNFDSIKQVVSAEIAKSVVGGQTALHDRDDMAQRAANSQSPAQLTGIVTEFKKLMAGQMRGLRKSYETSTGLKNFDDFLLPETKKQLSAVEAHGAAKEAGTAPAKPGTTAASKPPAGAVSTRKDRNGVNWYLDANGKPLGRVQ